MKPHEVKGAGKEVLTRDMRCIVCDAEINAATPVGELEARPKPGDVSICWYCGNIRIFKEDEELRDATPDELEEISSNENVKEALESIRANRGSHH